MTTLTDFLLARIAEDEAVARRVDDLDDGPGAIEMHVGLAPAATHQTGWLEVDPLRVLAECEAKRRIVERSSYADDTAPDYKAQAFEPGDSIATDNLHDLALVYADHPDYDEEWRP